MESRTARRWRDYQTASGGRPVRDSLMELNREQRAEVVAAMREVRIEGLRAARHLRGDIYEVRADARDLAFRVLFAEEGPRVLLSLEAFPKKTQRTPPARIELAERRLADWRSRRTASRRTHK